MIIVGHIVRRVGERVVPQPSAFRSRTKPLSKPWPPTGVTCHLMTSGTGCERLGSTFEGRLAKLKNWAEMDSNHRRQSQRIYSPPPLATWVSARFKSRAISIARFPALASCTTRNYQSTPPVAPGPPTRQFFGASVFSVTIRSTARCSTMSRGTISTGFFRRRCASCIASISGFTPATSAASLMCMRSVS